ncbi:2-C-methyl-D-erythritol 4-phosphate cytidylyltransferase [Pantoea sp. Aalb]|uniref:2-C-methyl-D-erythritol 4-phosphate cytidylyltransferase n=1 Tax=Pantoea sp. Aalb TaxID=2576762 RepID=UPI00132228D6|nr:2-C-methyl-D-erythritol 4-phosphate cytidylyltransferase [Pantoea sp. Aalb]MXP67764.1 2-C-methyl-D-erythritol 4-phosphate cytidylyltransferase [Pantoea sp. Aalb]
MNNSTQQLLSDVIAVIPAAGIGSRMQTPCPKQYLTIGQFTILEYSVACILAHRAIKKIVLVLNPDDQWFDSLPLAKDNRIIQIKTGGSIRAESVLAGLQAVYSDWVLIHDAVRPCLHLNDLKRLLLLQKYSKIGGILAVPVIDTIKFGNSEQKTIIKTIKRECLWHALTPQFFPRLLLTNCLKQALKRGVTITDEASALEYCGYYPELIVGRRDNIKVTKLEDLALVSFYLNINQTI